jgi:VanZ family protein
MPSATRTTLLFRVTLGTAVVAITRLATIPIDFEPAFDVNDKVAHTAAFFVLAFLVDFSYPRSRFGATKVTALLAYGMLIEAIQYFLPTRSFSLLDWVADAAGVGAYALCLPLLERLPWPSRDLPTRSST